MEQHGLWMKKSLVNNLKIYFDDVFFVECCRGDIVMKTETSTPVSTTYSTTPSTTSLKTTPTGNVILITGGGYKIEDDNATLHSAEIFLPNSPNTPCVLPDLPAPYAGHTQDGGMICGGYFNSTRYNCRKWNSNEGKFPKKPYHYFKPGRYHLVSWTPVSEKETFLMGGSGSAAINSTTIVKPGVTEGYKGFDLKDSLIGACSIPDPETDTLVITGGNTIYQTSDNNKITSLYNEDGFVEYLDNLNYPRLHHGCASYIAANKKRVLKKLSNKMFISLCRYYL